MRNTQESFLLDFKLYYQSSGRYQCNVSCNKTQISNLMRTTYSFPDQSKKDFRTINIAFLFFLNINLLIIMFVFKYPIRQIRSIEEHQLFTSSCLQEGSCLIYIICVCLCIVVSNTYHVVLLVCFSLSCVPYVASFSGLSICDCPFDILLRLFTD